MVKDIIKYKDKEFQLSTIYIENMVTFETMIFPIEDGIVSGREVYCFRTTKADESMDKHRDIYYHPEKYISEEAIANYIKEKEDWYEPDCVDEYLHDIWAIGVDYDGARSEKDLKELIDELVDMAKKARNCLWQNKLFGAYGSPKSEHSN